MRRGKFGKLFLACVRACVQEEKEFEVWDRSIVSVRRFRFFATLFTTIQQEMGFCGPENQCPPRGVAQNFSAVGNWGFTLDFLIGGYTLIRTADKKIPQFIW